MNYLVAPLAHANWGNIEVRMDRVMNGSEFRYETKLSLNSNTQTIVRFSPDIVIYSCMIAELGTASLERMPWVEDWMLICTTDELREHLTEGEIEELEFYKYGQEMRQSLIKLIGEYAFYTLARFVENRSKHKELDNELDLRLVLNDLGITAYEEQNDFLYWKPTSTKQN